MRPRGEAGAEREADGPAHDSRSALHEELTRVWRNLPGIRGQLMAVNHTTIGLRFIVTGFVFLLIGGLFAMFMRLQLAWSDQTVLDHQLYNELMTMHGTTMMFLFAVPVMEGFAVYLIPKMLGARDVPFPRASAFGYWCYLFGGLLLYSSFLFGAAPAGGWFMYVPLTGPEYTPGKSADFWLLGITFAEIAALTAAVEIIVAILKVRAPGMSIQRMPLFAWYMLATSFMIAFGFPPLILGSILLELERAFGFVFFDPLRGGDPLLWQHLFWIFGHPEVYIIFLPAAGIVSTVLPVFARRAIVGYTWVVLAVIATAFLSFGLWVHHMFVVGIPLLALSFFSAASMAVAIPMGVQVFAWIATLWGGRPELRLPMYFILGFFFIFVLGGLTGVMVALVPFDWQVHDTHFVVAHLHYVVIGGMLMPLFAGVYYWLPQITGRLPNLRLGRMAFWLIFIGFNLTFLPMHLTGLLGMPRRAYTYTPELGETAQWLNLGSTAAGFLLATGIIAFLVDVLLSIRHGPPAPANHWRADGLEWAMAGPPPVYNFASQPVVTSRTPLWDDAAFASLAGEGGGFLSGAPRGVRETLGTDLRTGRPEQVIRVSGSTLQPLLAALALAAAFTGILASVYWMTVIAVAAFVAVLLRWLWTTGDVDAPTWIDVDGPGGTTLRLPTQSACASAPGWWAMVLTVLIDVTVFASMVFAYCFLWLGASTWPPTGHALPGFLLPLTGLALLVGGDLSAWRARRRNALDDAAGVRRSLLGSAGCFIGFLVVQGMIVSGYAQAPGSHAFASVVYVLIGYQVLHAFIALLMAGFVGCRSRHARHSAARPLDLRILVLFCHATTGIGLVSFVLVHLLPGV